MKENVRICNCMDCQQASTRAMGILEGMMKNEECIQSVLAVASALLQHGAIGLKSVIRGQMIDQGAPSLSIELMCEEIAIRVIHGIQDKVGLYNANSAEHWDGELARISRELAEKKKAEEEMVKGGVNDPGVGGLRPDDPSSTA